MLKKGCRGQIRTKMSVQNWLLRGIMWQPLLGRQPFPKGSPVPREGGGTKADLSCRFVMLIYRLSIYLFL